MIRPGITTEEINTFVHEDTLAKGAIPAPLNYHGFPKSVCTSLNEVVCHGIPTPKQRLREGDIINVDVTSIFPKERGFFGDTSATFYIGEPSAMARRAASNMAAGPSSSGNPWPRLTAPRRAASADISAKMVVWKGRSRATVIPASCPSPRPTSPNQVVG